MAYGIASHSYGVRLLSKHIRIANALNSVLSFGILTLWTLMLYVFSHVHESNKRSQKSIKHNREHGNGTDTRSNSCR